MILIFTGVGSLLFLSACGGGGSSSNSSTVVTTPTATATPSLADCQTSASTQSKLRKTLSFPSAAVTAVPVTSYTLTSYPAGASVSNNGTSLGSTPYTFTPASTNTANFITFTSGSQQYTLCLSQAGFPSRTISYNAAGDTSGTIAAIATSSVVRTPLSSTQHAFPAAATFVRHALRHANRSQIDAGHLLVKYKTAVLQASSTTTLSIESRLHIADARPLGPQQGTTISRVVRVPQGTTAATLTNALLSNPAIDSVYPVHQRHTLSVTPVYPNDPEFTMDENHQWDMYQTQAPYAWGISTGSPTIAVAIIDTGYDPANLDLQGSKVTYSESVIDGTVTSGSTAAQDTDGHGTNVSGIAAADTNNATSVVGIGYNVSLQEYRIFPNPGESGYSSDPTLNGALPTDEAQAIYDAVSHGAKVISLSIGGPESEGVDQSEYDAVEYAIAQGITVVSAGGNERLPSDSYPQGVNTIDYPAAYPGVIAVGASALNDNATPNNRAEATEYVAAYSNSGPGLSLVAPGGDPSSTADTDFLHWILNLDTTQPAVTTRCSSLTNCLALFAGTSQATPHVAGAAALLLSVDIDLTPAQIKQILMTNADNINDPRQGAGRLNVYRALAAVGNVAAPAAPSYQNFVAFGYTNSGGTTPTIIDQTFLSGVPVNADGSFRLPDINPTTGSYKIGLWADVNGDGVIDAGDYFGGGTASCQSTSPCTTGASGITVAPVSSGFTLP